MPVYTLFGQPASPASLASDGSQYTMGVQFTVSQSATLTGIWFFSAPGAAGLPSSIALYQVSGTSLIHSETPSWSGAAGSGWVRAAFASPPSLTASTAYKACISEVDGNFFYSGTAHYWDTGAGASGITNGPLSAPNNAGASPGQDSFTQAGVLTYPSSSFNATNYWVDPEITTAGTPHNATASLTVTPSFSAARTRGHSRTGALTVTPSLSAAAAHTAAPPGAAKAQGGWWQLYSIIEYARQEREFYATRPPMACPRCGEPMRPAPPSDSGSEVELYCLFDGWQYPRDWVRPDY